MLKEGYRHYVLSILTLVYTLNSLDAGLMSLLLQPMKEDLRLSDTQLGVLTGIAFGLFYATLGVPIARWADRGNRTTIISLASALWGVTIMGCMWVANFAQLLLARVAAGVGEAGCLPSTYSLVGDYFPQPAERTRAMSIYMAANPLAALISFMLGGWLNQRYGWRITFFIMGVPALVIAALVKLTITETRRASPHAACDRSSLPPLGEVLRTLWRQRSTRRLGIGIVLLATMGNGLGPWYAAFMMRSHGMDTEQLGLWFGIIFGLAGVIGISLGGYLASRWFANREAWQMRLSAVTIALLVPCFLCFLLVSQKSGALLALFVLQLVFSVYAGPTYAVMQRLVVDNMRATSLAVILFMANLIGLGVGPQLVGVLSDLLQPAFANESLRYAMLLMSLVAWWAAYYFWRLGGSVEEDLAAIASRGSGQIEPGQPASAAAAVALGSG